MARVKIRFWKAIPVSVQVIGENDKASMQLPKIYMATVDAIATKTGLTGSSAYVAGFRTDASDRNGAAQAIAETIAAELREKYSPAWLREQRKLAGITLEAEARISAEAQDS